MSKRKEGPWHTDSIRGGLDEPQNLHLNELEQRMSVILGQMKEHLKVLQKQEEGYPGIQRALSDFHAFFEQYHRYFQVHVYDRHHKDPEMTNEYILKTALANTIKTWEMLARAISQRFNPVYVQSLQKADLYAFSLMERSESLFDYDQPLDEEEPESKTPIIYFEKFFHITRFLYRSHPMIAIPLDRSHLRGEQNELVRINNESGDPLAQDKRLGAIPHELGHYVFWNSGSLKESHQRMAILREQIMQTELKKTITELTFIHLEDSQQKINQTIKDLYIWLGWLEETFADVFGTLLLGGIYAKSSQDLIVREVIGTSSDLYHNDGEHPLPYLRPLIATTTLQLMAQEAKNEENIGLATDLEDLASQLRQRWEQYLEKMSKHKHDNEDKLPSGVDEHQHSHDHLHRDEEEPERAKALVKYIEPVVKVILFHEIFILNEKGQGKRLIDCVNYWGKDENSQKQIKLCLDEVENDPLMPQTEEIHSDNSVGQSPVDIPYDEKQKEYPHLADLFEYMAFLGENGEETELSELWKALLDLPLSMQAGHGEGDDEIETHTHPIKHKHTWWGIRIV